MVPVWERGWQSQAESSRVAISKQRPCTSVPYARTVSGEISLESDGAEQAGHQVGVGYRVGGGPDVRTNTVS